jgi:hypothetical protein
MRKIFLFCFLLSCCLSCSHLSEISICSNLQQGDSISVALYSIANNQYCSVNGAKVSGNDVKHHKIAVLLPDSLLRNIGALSITLHLCADTIFTVSSIQLNKRSTIYPKAILETLWWQEGLSFQYDTVAHTISSRVYQLPCIFPIGIMSFYQPKLVGFQRFLRLSFLATLLALFALFWRKAIKN